MTQLVFVHGVATRQDPAYDKEVAMRDDLFRKVGFGGASSLTILNSYWGGHASSLAFGDASLPRNGQGVASFSLLGGLGLGAAATSSQTLSNLAVIDFATAVDALFVTLVDNATAEGRMLSDEEMATYSAAAAYAAENPAPYWFQTGMPDVAFIDQLRAHLPLPAAPAAFGLGDSLKKAAADLFNKGRNLVATGLTNAFRDDLNPAVAKFIGDVFVYLRDGDRRDAIRKIIIGDLVTADGRRGPGEKLVVIGHSLGGVILYDLLSARPPGLPAGLTVDLLLTVGSQPGLFEELKLFAASDPAIPNAGKKKAGKLANVGGWLNVYDPVDLFGFRAQPMFDDCTDLIFSSATGLMDAHTAYFKRPQFHQRLAARLKSGNLVP